MRSPIAALTLLTACLVAWPADAAELERFEPTREEHLLGLSGVHVFTGWVPANSPIQVSFELSVSDTVEAEMLGDAVYDWEDQNLAFVGDPDGGLFAIDVGVLLDARVRFDLVGVQFESALIGPYDLVADGGVLFDPYLLPGNPDRPALIDVQTEPTEVYTVPLVDAVIASGELVVDAAFDVQVQLQCESIEANPEHQDSVLAIESLEPVALSSPSAGALMVDATLRCTTLSTVTVLLYPSVVVTIGFEEFSLSPFELPVPVLVDSDAPFDFDPVALMFEDQPEPEPEPADGSDDEGGGSGEDGAAGVDESDSGGDTGNTQTGTGGDSGQAGGGEGCSCRADQGPAGWGAAWLMVLLVGRRRRR